MALQGDDAPAFHKPIHDVLEVLDVEYQVHLSEKVFISQPWLEDDVVQYGGDEIDPQ